MQLESPSIPLHQLPEQQESMGQDKNSVVFIFIVLFGIGSFLPYNTIITGIEFFDHNVII